MEGHCLILPNRHVTYAKDLTDAELLEIHEVIKKVELATKKVFHTVSYIIVQKNGIESGQTVPHVLFHYYPQKKAEGDVFQFAYRSILATMRSPIRPAEMLATVNKLREAIAQNDLPK